MRRILLPRKEIDPPKRATISRVPVGSHLRSARTVIKRGIQPQRGIGTCVSCSNPTEGEDHLALKLGTVRHALRGPVFEPHHSNLEFTLHTLCAFHRGLDQEFLESNKCAYCGNQFYEEESSWEIDLVVGGRTTEYGFAHWACVRDEWELPKWIWEVW